MYMYDMHIHINASFVTDRVRARISTYYLSRRKLVAGGCLPEEVGQGHVHQVSN